MYKPAALYKMKPLDTYQLSILVRLGTDGILRIKSNNQWFDLGPEDDDTARQFMQGVIKHGREWVRRTDREGA